MRTKLAHLKEQAISLRMDGYSYGQIKKALGLKSKGTISYWLKNIPLSEQSKKKLLKNMELATERGLFVFNKNRTEKIKQENELAVKNGFKIIPNNLSKRDLLLIGTALYCGEGTKSWGEKSYPRFSFANSDPNMIKICMRYLREILGVDDSKITGGIHLYPSTDVTTAINFWTKTTGIQKFYVIHQISRAGQNLRKNILPYGTLHVKAGGRLVYFKVKGLMNGLMANLDK